MPVYQFADAHCHLDSCSGIVEPHILHITSGYSHESNLKASHVAKEHDNVYLTAGISPQEAMKHPDIKIKLVEWENEIARLPKLVAIGEIGLDFHYAKTQEERFFQHECFISQLSLAERMGLPVVVHSRDAESECLDILHNFNIDYMLHCFSGSAEIAAAAAAHKGIISIPPIRSKERRKFITDLPLGKLVAESDAPYIGKTPADALESIKMIAEIKGASEDDSRIQTLMNTVSFFKIG